MTSEETEEMRQEWWRSVQGDILTANGVAKSLGFVWDQIEECSIGSRLDGLDAASFLAQELEHHATSIRKRVAELWSSKEKMAADFAPSE